MISLINLFVLVFNVFGGNVILIVIKGVGDYVLNVMLEEGLVQILLVGLCFWVNMIGVVVDWLVLI